MGVSVVVRSRSQIGSSWWRRVLAVARQGMRNLDAQCDAYQGVMFPGAASRLDGHGRENGPRDSCGDLQLTGTGKEQESEP